MTKILLVEDDKSLREIYGVRLLAEGYDIVSAGDGEQALAMAIKERPQLIVSDVMMPKISGFDMLDILRSTTETKDIKVIMMTALSSEDQRARGQALGADRYLVKSQVGIEDVVRTVHEVLGDALTPSSQPFTAPSVPRPAPVTAPASRPEPTTPPLSTQATHPATPPAPSFNSAPPPPPRTSSLPQPTAPFSTTRPANLGERVIHPISQPPTASKPDISSLMDQELAGPQLAPTSASSPMTTPPTPQTPPLPPTPQVIPPPQPPTVQPQKDPDIAFEETPLPPPPPGNPAPQS